MHVPDLLTHELLSLNIEQKHTVDDIADKIVELEKVLASLQMKLYSANTNLDHK